MIHVIVIGDEEFYHDADRTKAQIGHLILSAIDDMERSIAGLARKFAPGFLDASVGETKAIGYGGNLYRGEVGVRNIPPYAKFVYEGTGVFGPLHRPYTIRKKQENPGPNWGIDRTGRRNPAVGNVFKIPGGTGGGRGLMIDGAFHYFRKEVTVMGQRPQPYLGRAYEIASQTEVPLRVHRLAHEIVR